MFRTVFPSSGVLDRARDGMNSISCPLASSQLTCMAHTWCCV